LDDTGSRFVVELGLTTSSTGQIESNYDETVDSFDTMDLKPELLRGVYAYGFERPSAIQQRAIMPVIKGKDLTTTKIFFATTRLTT
jgi:translation initiation factor 4A